MSEGYMTYTSLVGKRTNFTTDLLWRVKFNLLQYLYLIEEY